MCMKATCSTCSEFPPISVSTDQYLLITDKVTWWGCGSHIPSVMDSIPEGEWCSCTPQVEKDGKKYPPKAAKAG